MNTVANMPREQREELFILTGRSMRLPEAVIEKDFWVCWILNYLFHNSQWKDFFSLLKAEPACRNAMGL